MTTETYSFLPREGNPITAAELGQKIAAVPQFQILDSFGETFLVMAPCDLADAFARANPGVHVQQQAPVPVPDTRRKPKPPAQG
jgi:hypothetical protein